MKTSADASEQTWNQPTDYERWYASSLGRAYGASLERVLQPWLRRLNAGLILDAGCGPGLALERLLPRTRPVVGMDCSLEMARRALARSRRTIIVGSIEQIPIPDAQFDLVFCVNCLEFVSDREAAFREIARILRPGGTAILGVLNRRSIWEVTRRMRRPFRRDSYYGGRFYAPDELRTCCSTAGLHVEELRSAVHFPPIPPGPFKGVYDRLDRSRQRRAYARGAVIVCRAVKQCGVSP